MSAQDDNADSAPATDPPADGGAAVSTDPPAPPAPEAKTESSTGGSGIPVASGKIEKPKRNRSSIPVYVRPLHDKMNNMERVILEMAEAKKARRAAKDAARKKVTIKEPEVESEPEPEPTTQHAPQAEVVGEPEGEELQQQPEDAEEMTDVSESESEQEFDEEFTPSPFLRKMPRAF